MAVARVPSVDVRCRGPRRVGSLAGFLVTSPRVLRYTPPQRTRWGAALGQHYALSQPPAPHHTHSFLPDEEYDADTDMWTKRCACGFSLVYERI